MWQRILDFITTKADIIQADYSVNPYIFLALLVACAPFFYYSIFRLARAVVRREVGLLARWGAIFLAATSTPYLYVLLFGRNMPWWIYAILGVLLLQGVITLICKLTRRGPGEGGPSTKYPEA